jgi:hypothetical protein
MTTTIETTEETMTLEDIRKHTTDRLNDLPAGTLTLVALLLTALETMPAQDGDELIDGYLSGAVVNLGIYRTASNRTGIATSIEPIGDPMIAAIQAGYDQAMPLSALN